MPVTKTFDLSALSDETLNIGSSFSRLDIYVGHLKRDLKCKALRQYHFLLSDCDEYGRLVKTDVFVQFLGVKSRGSVTYALLCQTCNNQKEGLRQILLKNDIELEFLERIRRDYCIHCKAVSEMNPEKIFELDNFPFYFGDDLTDVEIIDKQPYKCAVMVNGEYGLLTFPPRAKKPRCVMPCKNSKSCQHCFLWEKTEGTHVVENNKEKPITIRKKDSLESNRTLPRKMKWPPTQDTQT